MDSKRYFWVFLFLILLAGFSSASFELGEQGIQTEYNSSETFLKGWIEMDFTEESNESLFEDSEGNSVSLQSMLVINPNFDYDVSGDGSVNSTGLQRLSFNNGAFSLPTTEENFTYQLNFSGNEIFLGNLTISSETQQNASSLLDEKILEVESLRTKISEYDLFSQEGIIFILGLDSIEDNLDFLKFSYESSTMTEEEIIANISGIDLPSTILQTKSANSIPVIPKQVYVNLEILTEVTGESYDFERESEFENAVLGWTINNADLEVSLSEYSGIYDGSQSQILTVFDLAVNRKSDTSYPIYLFIEDQKDYEFEQGYGEVNGNYYIVEILSDKETFSFYTEREMNFEDLRFFVSPQLSTLSADDFEVEPFEEPSNFKWVIFVLVVIFLMIIGFIVYVVLQVWYKKKYEAYLFKNKNDLYNIANYIHLSKKKGMDNGEIEKNLRKAKWGGEQITYAMRKYSGKRTGMFEIPLGKILDKTEDKPSDSRKFRNFGNR